MYESCSAPSPTVKSTAAGCIAPVIEMLCVATVLPSIQYTIVAAFQSILNRCEPVNNLLPAIGVSIVVPVMMERARSCPAVVVPNIANGGSGAFTVPKPASWPAAPLNEAVNSSERPDAQELV